ncbi:uncharacterized protein LOC117817690 isoform X1 [Xyrichtys novacula]|uniref:Uncharacterized protein LOC117817690 isoform X1 n=1 Tax=Xyrichtys novacula TaxID=13765 RepID=A0AAV1FC55_XYRNO|nr:uncharacterized protein LOC117817690 isoform X1 [Xyrichtys novacula]
MNWRLAALILLGTACQTMPHQISMTVVQPGGDFSLSCSVGMNKAGLFYWYKLKFGYSVQKVAGGSFQTLKLEEQFENSRVEVSQKDTVYFLNIRNVSKEDEATYFCQAGTAYEMIALNGSLLAVNDHQNHQKSVYVKQRPETQSVQAGDSVSLQCSLLFKYKETRVQCPHEHNVYWFRAGSGESPLGVVYTHKSRSFKEEERGCVYSLSKTIQNSSDAGTYYCAVVTCGEILFGEGTTVQTRDTSLLYIALGVLLPYCVFVTAALIISRNQKPVCGQCKGEITASSQGEHYRSAEAHQNYQVT